MASSEQLQRQHVPCDMTRKKMKEDSVDNENASTKRMKTATQKQDHSRYLCGCNEAGLSRSVVTTRGKAPGVVARACKGCWCSTRVKGPDTIPTGDAYDGSRSPGGCSVWRASWRMRHGGTRIRSYTIIGREVK